MARTVHSLAAWCMQEREMGSGRNGAALVGAMHVARKINGKWMGRWSGGRVCCRHLAYAGGVAEADASNENANM